MLPIVSIIGHHDAGKTRVISALIDELSERGLRVGAVKHAPHLETARPEGADSERLRAAGAAHVLLLARDAAVLTTPLPASDDLPETLQRTFSGRCDLVLVEGLKRGPFPKIEVFRRAGRVPQQPLAGAIEVAAVITDGAVGLPDGVPSFSPSDIAGIADFIENRFLIAP